MTENDTRKEIIRVFRKSERLGLSREGLDPVRAYKRIDVLCASRRGKLDMFAVYDTMRILSLLGEEDVISAVRRVYFVDVAYRLTASMISDRVLKCACEQYCDARTIYRRLKRARELYASIRKNLDEF